MTDSSPDTVLLFDMMSTVVYDPFYEHMPDFFGMTLEELVDAKAEGVWFEFERGEIDETTLARRFFEDRESIDLEGLKRRFRDEYRFLEGMEPLLAELETKGFDMHVLSNYGPWYHMIEAKLEVSRFLEWSFVSCDTGFRKPAPETYRHVLETLQVPPEQCLFIDDREANLEGAREMGLRALRFEGADDTRAELAEHLNLEWEHASDTGSSPGPR